MNIFFSLLPTHLLDEIKKRKKREREVERGTPSEEEEEEKREIKEYHFSSSNLGENLHLLLVGE